MTSSSLKEVRKPRTPSSHDAGENEEEDEESKSRRMKLVPHGDRWVERLRSLESEGFFEDLIVDASTC